MSIKKAILSVLCSLMVRFAAAQTAELLIGEQQKLFVEKTAETKNTCTFAYIESTYSGGAMADIFHEQKFWEPHVFAHIEYQTTFDGNNVYLAGPGFYKYTKHGFIEALPMLRYDGRFCWQASLVYLFDFKHLEIYGYNHLWGQNTACFFGEERLHLKLGRHLRIGGVLDIAYFSTLTVTPYAGLRYDF